MAFWLAQMGKRLGLFLSTRDYQCSVTIVVCWDMILSTVPVTSLTKNNKEVPFQQVVESKWGSYGVRPDEELSARYNG